MAINVRREEMTDTEKLADAQIKKRMMDGALADRVWTTVDPVTADQTFHFERAGRPKHFIMRVSDENMTDNWLSDLITFAWRGLNNIDKECGFLPQKEAQNDQK